MKSTKRVVRAAELVERHEPDVVVIDASDSLGDAARSVAAIEALYPKVGVLVVCDGEPPRWTTGLKVTEKWAALETLPGGHPCPDRRARLDGEHARVQPARPRASPQRSRTVRALPRTWQLAAGVSSLTLVAACFARFGLSGRAVVGGFFATVLVVLSAIDLDRRLIPNVIVLPATVVVLVAQIALYPDHTLEWVVASLGAALFFFLPLLVFPTGMGMGDVKLAALLGAALGQSVAGAILAGLLAGAVVRVRLLVRGGMSARKKAFAYGPFLAFGGVLVLLLGGR